MVPVGGQVPIVAILPDGNEKMRVMVTVTGPDSKILFEGECVSTGMGRYEYRQFLMPDLPFVVATFVVFDGKTESRDYVRGGETFERACEPIDISGPVRALLDEKLPADDGFISGKIIGESQTDDFIEGVLNGDI